MLRRKGQAVSLDMIIGITLFLGMIVLFYYLFGMGVTENNEEEAAAAIVEGLQGNKYFTDDILDADELTEISGMDCDELKNFLNTNSHVCIYGTDKYGNLVPLDGKNGLGCGGIKIEDSFCGQP